MLATYDDHIITRPLCACLQKVSDIYSSCIAEQSKDAANKYHPPITKTRPSPSTTSHTYIVSNTVCLYDQSITHCHWVIRLKK